MPPSESRSSFQSKPAIQGLVLFLSTSHLLAGGTPEAKDSKSILVPPPSSGDWSFGVGYAPLFNTSASFSSRSPGIAGIPLIPAGPVFGDYDDGYVRPDISGSDSLTTNWSYNDDSQYDPSGGGTLSFTSAAGGGALPSMSRGGDDASGELAFEVFADLELGRIGGPSSPTAWGIHMGFHYADLDASDAGVSSGNAISIVDRFPLGGVIPPLAPYTGSFAGPGPLLDTNVGRSTVTAPGGSSISRSNDLHTNLFSLNLGPWISYAPSERFQARAEAGLTLGLADSSYTYASTTSLPGGASATVAGRVSETTVLPGFYVGAMAAYALNERVEVYLSARYQYLDRLSLGSPAASAELSFDEAFILSVGLRCGF